ncbi:MAG: hypothetical protein LZF86_110206 [Nitrospira sp.]|nr:MAG: hypothetical protein LZF86_110206 [Nitrospira sp.]
MLYHRCTSPYPPGSQPFDSPLLTYQQDQCYCMNAIILRLTAHRNNGLVTSSYSLTFCPLGLPLTRGKLATVLPCLLRQNATEPTPVSADNRERAMPLQRTILSLYGAYNLFS